MGYVSEKWFWHHILGAGYGVIVEVMESPGRILAEQYPPPSALDGHILLTQVAKQMSFH